MNDDNDVIDTAPPRSFAERHALVYVPLMWLLWVNRLRKGEWV